MKIMIAGASGGIGNYLTQKFDKSDNELFLTYNTSEERVFHTKYAKSNRCKVNFSIEEDVRKTYEEINDLDVLINTMGHVENVLVINMSEDIWDRVISSNLKTIFLSCKYAFDKIVEHGHIINISSILGTTGMAGASHYVASKGGVESFTKSFALECLYKKKVYVNAIALGYFKIGMGLNLSDKVEKMVKEKIPLKDFGEPEEILRLIEYIISSRYLVGQIIHLNGGLRL